MEIRINISLVNKPAGKRLKPFPIPLIVGLMTYFKAVSGFWWMTHQTDCKQIYRLFTFSITPLSIDEGSITEYDISLGYKC